MRCRSRPALYVVAVVVAWCAGLIFSGSAGHAVLPVAMVLALPIAAVLAIRTRPAVNGDTYTPPPNEGDQEEVEVV